MAQQKLRGFSSGPVVSRWHVGQRFDLDVCGMVENCELTSQSLDLYLYESGGVGEGGHWVDLVRDIFFHIFPKIRYV